MYYATIFRAAEVMLEKFGKAAESMARARQQSFLAKNDVRGFARWGDVVAAIEELQRTERRDGEPQH